MLIWIDPLDRNLKNGKLDELLKYHHSRGVNISAHPSSIEKIGTKKILYDLKDTIWSNDICLYHSIAEFKSSFFESFKANRIRVLKQYRGNDGIKVYKVKYINEMYEVVEAPKNSKPMIVDINRLAEIVFENNDQIIINQEWFDELDNGVVRCYFVGSKIGGFGYQEINAFYPHETLSPRKRFYLTEKCGLFRDLSDKVKNNFIPTLLDKANIKEEELPFIWDADFFIGSDRYILCEINASCVSPFPPSTIQYIYNKIINA